MSARRWVVGDVLVVQVEVNNTGIAPANQVTVVVEVLGVRRQARVADKLGDGEQGQAVLRFPLAEKLPFRLSPRSAINTVKEAVKEAVSV